jgi:hypothetical protein
MVEYRETCRTCEGVGTVAIESTLTYPEGDPEIKRGGSDDRQTTITPHGHYYPGLRRVREGGTIRCPNPAHLLPCAPHPGGSL